MVNLDQSIRKVPDFPHKGVLFYDITSLLQDHHAFSHVIDQMVNLYQNKGITHIIAVESRGFLFASPLALALKLPIILARKEGKLPNRTIKQTYSLEYGTATLEIQEVDLVKNMKVLLVDDLIATGGTLKATAEMLESRGAKISGIFSVIGLPFLDYQKALKNYEVNTLINYDSELVENK